MGKRGSFEFGNTTRVVQQLLVWPNHLQLKIQLHVLQPWRSVGGVECKGGSGSWHVEQSAQERSVRKSFLPTQTEVKRCHGQAAKCGGQLRAHLLQCRVLRSGCREIGRRDKGRGPLKEEQGTGQSEPLIWKEKRRGRRRGRWNAKLREQWRRCQNYSRSTDPKICDENNVGVTRVLKDLAPLIQSGACLTGFLIRRSLATFPLFLSCFFKGSLLHFQTRPTFLDDRASFEQSAIFGDNLSQI